MAERFEFALWRHLRVAEILSILGEHDDSGYHSGVSGENALKALLQLSGVEAGWVRGGINLRATPMRGHFPNLQAAVQAAAVDIATYASGRFSPSISNYVLSPSFSARFIGWEIDIRYADTSCTPVSQADSDRWLSDAMDLALATAI